MPCKNSLYKLPSMHSGSVFRQAGCFGAVEAAMEGKQLLPTNHQSPLETGFSPPPLPSPRCYLFIDCGAQTTPHTPPKRKKKKQRRKTARYKVFTEKFDYFENMEIKSETHFRHSSRWEESIGLRGSLLDSVSAS